MAEHKKSSETLLQPLSGWPVLGGLFLAEALSVVSMVMRRPPDEQIAFQVIVSAALFVLCLPGFFVVGPNMSRALVLFGNYKGTVRRRGLFWTNPFTSKRCISLKANNVASEIIKVNDQRGNPIQIGAVVVWLVEDTAQALFDVEDYSQYVDIQIETALRQVASTHPYDGEDQEEAVVSLRGDGATVAEELEAELKKRLHRAGIEVLEARLSHLAYASEIASAMLQRQQAEAIIAARKKIVEGAVSMVEHALRDLGSRGVVELDDVHRAALVGNLLVVLCGHTSPQTVVNAGTSAL